MGAFAEAKGTVAAGAWAGHISPYHQGDPMKPKIHPKYYAAKVHCATCGTEFVVVPAFSIYRTMCGWLVQPHAGRAWDCFATVEDAKTFAEHFGIAADEPANEAPSLVGPPIVSKRSASFTGQRSRSE